MREQDPAIAQLRAADESLGQERLRPRSVHRIAGRLSAELQRPYARRRGVLPMLTFVAGAVMVIVFLSWAGRTTTSSQEPDRVAATSVTGTGCRYQGGARLEVSGACHIEMRAAPMKIRTHESARLTVEERRVELHGGSAHFDVDPVVGEPVRISAPGGEIVVVGTRFWVSVHTDRSRIELFEGELELRPDAGPVTTMLAGQIRVLTSESALLEVTSGSNTTTVDDTTPPSTGVLSPPSSPGSPADLDLPRTPTDEPRRATTGPTRNEAAPRAKGPTPPKADRTGSPNVEDRRDQAAALIAELRALRRRGKLDEAARRLTEALAEPWPPRTAEVLSYELGTILARHLGDPKRACAHWRGHLERFANTKRRAPVERSMATLGCRAP